MIREIIFWGNYFDDFFNKQETKVQKRIDFVLTTFKEIRILCFFDEKRLIVTVNCFIKKTRKTPKNGIKLGLKLKREYFSYKERKKQR